MSKCPYKICDGSGFVMVIKIQDQIGKRFIPRNMGVNRFYELLEKNAVITNNIISCKCEFDKLEERFANEFDAGRRKAPDLNPRAFFIPFYNIVFAEQKQIIFDRIYFNYTTDLYLAINCWRKFQLKYHDKEHHEAILELLQEERQKMKTINKQEVF